MAIAGKDYVVVASDTRQSDGYLINSRYSSKSFQLYLPFQSSNFSTDYSVICVNGFHADGLELTKEIKSRIRQYTYQHGSTISTQSIAQMVSIILYGKRFFPYYSFVLLAGIDANGKGEVYSFDPVGSFELEVARASGSAAALMQPVLDCQIYQKNQNKTAKVETDCDQAIMVAKDLFSAAAERDIYTGDFVDIWTIKKGYLKHDVYPIRKD